MGLRIGFGTSARSGSFTVSSTLRQIFAAKLRNSAQGRANRFASASL
jgi:hypothetical protein